MAKFEAIGINWDAPKDVKKTLPKNDVVICDDEEDVVDTLSDKYGWCINSLEEIVEC